MSRPGSGCDARGAARILRDRGSRWRARCGGVGTKLAGEFDSPAATPEASDPDRPTEIDEPPFSSRGDQRSSGAGWSQPVQPASPRLPDVRGPARRWLSRPVDQGSVRRPGGRRRTLPVHRRAEARSVAGPECRRSEARFDLVASPTTTAVPTTLAVESGVGIPVGIRDRLHHRDGALQGLTDACPAVLRQPGLVVQLPDITGPCPRPTPGGLSVVPVPDGGLRHRRQLRAPS